MPPLKGKSHTPEARAAMSAAAKARGSNRLGKQHSVETRAKISRIVRDRAVRGADAPGYIDGKGHERLGLRHTSALKRWRYDVFSRDGFACVHCGDNRGGNLQAHHIRPFTTHPELRFDPRNGVTLCKACHRLVHAYGLQLWSPNQ